MEFIYLVDALTAAILLYYGVRQWWSFQQAHFGRIIDDGMGLIVGTLGWVATYLLIVIVLPEGDTGIARVAPVMFFPMVMWIIRIVRGGGRLILRF